MRFQEFGERKIRNISAPASALHAMSRASWDADAMSDSDIGSVRIVKSHAAAPPAAAIAMAPNATAVTPVSNRETTNVCTTLNFAFRPANTPIAEGR
jgi:hypothetical protein